MTLTFDLGPGLLTLCFFILIAIVLLTWHIIEDKPWK